MNARRIAAVALLVFAAGSLGAAVYKHVNPPVVEASDEPAPHDGAIVYYLHGSFRCESCTTLEAAIEEVVATEFADDVAAGRLQLRIANYLENEQLSAKYAPAGPTVVVVPYEDGQEKEDGWYKLDRALELAAGSRRQLDDYLKMGIRDGVPQRSLEMALWAALAAAFGFGLLTAISPCPLATNIAAVSFLGRHASQPRKVLLSGLAYTAGRTVVYVVLGVVIIWLLQHPWIGGDSDASKASISRFLETYGGMIIGPVLVVAGAVLLGLLRSSRSLTLAGQGLQQKAAKGGVAWAFVLGVLFALSFCPLSAMIFFGSMITLSTANQSAVLLPTAFGVATALPVIVFAFLIAFAARYVGVAFARMTQLDRWLRLTTGAVFVAAGAFYSLTHLGIF